MPRTEQMKWSRSSVSAHFILAVALGTCVHFLLNGCTIRRAAAKPSIEFSVIPPAAEGGPERREPIAGRVTGARAGQRIVLFARAGVWWVQPMREEPFTSLQPD